MRADSRSNVSRASSSELAARPGIHHQAREVLFVAEVAENHLDLAGHQLEHVDLVVQDRQDALFDASGQTQIEDVDIARLAMRWTRPTRCSIVTGFQGKS